MNAKHTNKSGAALVITLGFLAVLILMVVAFSAQTRSGRLAGRAYLAHAQAGQLLNTAVSRAMEDLDRAAGKTYPAFYATNSTGDGLRWSETMEFGMEEDYFPAGNDAIWNAYLAALETAEWQTIASGGVAIGRIGYIIINTSGLLDANHVAGLASISPPKAKERMAGLSPSELQLSAELVDELEESPGLVLADGTTSPADSPTSAFAFNRDTAWQRFESLRDVALLNQHAGNVLGLPIASFNIHSLFPQANPPDRIRLTPGIGKNVFTSALLSCGLSAKQAEHVYDNYRDYIDDDDIPRNLEGSSPEATPMVNEIWIQDFAFSQTSSDGTNIEYRVSGKLSVETWFPFANKHPLNKRISCSAADPNLDVDAGLVEIVEGETHVNQRNYITVTAIYPNNFAKSFVLELDRTGASPIIEGNFSTTEYEFLFHDAVALAQPFENGEIQEPVGFRTLLDQIDVIDNVPLDRVRNIVLPFRNLGTGTFLSAHASCIDPRINWDFTDAQQWDTGAAPTPNKPNAIEEWGEESDLADKRNIRFFVRNAPMENAAELGFLSIGEPWRTVRLSGGEGGFAMNPVLDRFTAGESIWDLPARPGLINMNTPNANAAATAFYDAPTHLLPDVATDRPRITAAQARILGSNLTRQTGGTMQTNLSFIGNAVSNNIPGWNEWTDAQKDSLVANSYRLFGWRDTQYVLLLAAQAGTDFNEDGVISDDEARATRKAVAQIWRDPVTQKAACVFFGLSDTLQSSIGSGETWGTILKDFRPD